ncbi:hypothetical protein EYF80_014062 [Liparis tanakae]|uniref:Uncharacterized protein n=1 Tax=Liparis tanakae TaxID=230148 RepID=A0A4Z2ICC6_9TELE|nr:hypothetical protein EYF80_014062 [Liparis tanakae]
MLQQNGSASVQQLPSRGQELLFQEVLKWRFCQYQKRQQARGGQQAQLHQTVEVSSQQDMRNIHRRFPQPVRDRCSQQREPINLRGNNKQLRVSEWKKLLHIGANQSHEHDQTHLAKSNQNKSDELGPVMTLTLPCDSELWKELATNTGEHSSNSGWEQLHSTREVFERNIKEAAINNKSQSACVGVQDQQDALRDGKRCLCCLWMG